ncbi:MAG: MCE family protein [Propionibacteriales bacterium]|nr:MCE family protein [Propionibacteriales bacterium]
MISARTKKQLLVFVFLTLVGVSYVGARYARLDRLVYDSAYQVNAEFAQSGGIFTGAEVTYRGVKVGQVSDMKLTRDGVDVVLSIDKSHDQIPADTLALVGNKSAVGEQYVDLEPRVDKGPYLKDNSEISTPNTEVPKSTTQILTSVDQFVNSVPQDDLRTVVSELGAGFKGSGDDLARIIDTSDEFIQAANQNFDVTTALIKDSNTVLRTQSDKGSAIRSFSQDLALFSGVVADNDAALRSLIDNGSATANELRTFLEENQVDLGGTRSPAVTPSRPRTPRATTPASASSSTRTRPCARRATTRRSGARRPTGPTRRWTRTPTAPSRRARPTPVVRRTPRAPARRTAPAPARRSPATTSPPTSWRGATTPPKAPVRSSTTAAPPASTATTRGRPCSGRR